MHDGRLTYPDVHVKHDKENFNPILVTSRELCLDANSVDWPLITCIGPRKETMSERVDR